MREVKTHFLWSRVDGGWRDLWDGVTDNTSVYMIENIHPFKCSHGIFFSEKGTLHLLGPVFEDICKISSQLWKIFPTSALCVELHVELYLAQKQGLCSLIWPLPGDSEQACSCSPSPLALFWAALSLSYFQTRNNSAHSTIALSSLKHSHVHVGGTGNSWCEGLSVPSSPSSLSAFHFCPVPGSKVMPLIFPTNRPMIKYKENIFFYMWVMLCNLHYLPHSPPLQRLYKMEQKLLSSFTLAETMV